MNAIEMLKEQHTEIEDLFERCEQAEGDDRQQTFLQIADKLAIHATLEEEHFYPACKSEETEPLLLEAVEEHLQMKRQIAELLNIPVDEPRFAAALEVLEETVLHHVKDEEEPKLFPMAEALLGDDKLDELGVEMGATLAELEEAGEPRNAVFEELEAPAPL